MREAGSPWKVSVAVDPKLIGATNVRLIANKIAGEPTPATYDFKAAAIPSCWRPAGSGKRGVAGKYHGWGQTELYRAVVRDAGSEANKIKPGGGGWRHGALTRPSPQGENHATGREDPLCQHYLPRMQPQYAADGHSDQGGRPDGVQLMVHRGFAYIGHMVSGFSVVDVRDPTRPTTVNYIAAPPGTERASAGA